MSEITEPMRGNPHGALYIMMMTTTKTITNQFEEGVG